MVTVLFSGLHSQYHTPVHLHQKITKSMAKETRNSLSSIHHHPPTTHPSPSLKVLRMQNPMHIPLLDPLQRQRGNQRRADAAPVLGRQDLDWVLLLRVGLVGPVENLAQRGGAARLEVRVFVEDGAVGAHVARRVALLAADGGDAAGRQAGGAGADQLGGATDELELVLAGVDAELGVEEVGGFGEVVLVRVPEGGGGQLLVFGGGGKRGRYSSMAERKDESRL